MGLRNERLTRREQQVMEVLYGVRQATVADLVERMAGEMTYSAVRSVLRVLIRKGKVRRRYSGPRYVYAPSIRAEQARGQAIAHLVQTFFDGSSAAAAVALLRRADIELNDGAFKTLAEQIRRAEQEGR